MAIPSWPAGLPQVSLLDSISIPEPYRAADVTEFESGPDRMRPAPGATRGVMPWAGVLSSTKFAAFKAFVHGDLYRGTMRFRMPVVTPEGCVTRTVHLQGATYQASMLASGSWRVSFTLIVFNW